ncbi:DUF4405 domain-containing protein [Shimia aestuarii]|uniref:DUF4405 domain-containing protein n=1 Tax=Shimia aestuarii TaxID=254406 RepID=UPI001FB435DC|nr:DUF4405 domain-containing protein [Shimia aestuarii]
MYLRKWATPLTIGSFLVMGVTGTLMFFHLDEGLNKLLHEWAGWAMLVAVGAHVLLNWRAFQIYFKRPVALGIMVVAAGALLLSFVPVDAGGGSPVPHVMRALSDAPVEHVIAIAGVDLQEGLTRLREAGYPIEAGQAIADVAQGDRGASMTAMKSLFVP